MSSDSITRIRRFNRAVTTEAGALDASYLGRGRPLGSARVLCAIGAGGCDLAVLRDSLSLDSGLLSRLLRGLEEEGLIVVEPDATDRRRRTARPTETGQTEIAAYERLSNVRAADILAALPRQRDDLLAAMDLIATALNRDRVDIRPADPDDSAAITCLAAYFALLAGKIPEVTPAMSPLPDPGAARYRAPDGRFLIAWSDGLPVGCVSLRRLEPGLGEIKRLWVHADARGQGLARRLMLAIEAEARATGLTRLVLDTNAALTEALALYRATGWAEIAPYSGPPSTHWFGKDL